mmetsp:Transcript_69254/g.149415  ORF Transcript_69254/g.149415 Transcript_69254/m.149415 type:complete len:207 (+) Transcript_69254:15-635(+)
MNSLKNYNLQQSISSYSNSKSESKVISESILCVELSSDGHTLFVGTKDPIVLIFRKSQDTGTQNSQFRYWGELPNVHTDAVWSISVSKDCNTVVTACADKIVRVFELNSSKNDYEFKQGLDSHTDCVFSVVLSQDNSKIISGSKDKNICVFSNKDKTKKLFELVQTLSEHSLTVFTVVLTDDNNQIISGSADSMVKVYNLDKEDNK